jgi:hypothetical protein
MNLPQDKSSNEPVTPSGKKKPGELTLLTKPKEKAGTPKTRARSALRAVMTTSSSAASESLLQAKERRLSLPPAPCGISVVREVAHFKALEEALDKPPSAYMKHGPKHVMTKEEKAEDKEWDRKHVLFLKEQEEKKAAIQKWADEGGDYDKHPFASRKTLEDKDELTRSLNLDKAIRERAWGKEFEEHRKEQKSAEKKKKKEMLAIKLAKELASQL